MVNYKLVSETQKLMKAGGSEVSLKQEEIGEVLKYFLATVVNLVEEEKSVILPKFGSFSLKEKSGVIQTKGKSIPYENRRYISFTASKVLKDYLSGDNE